MIETMTEANGPQIGHAIRRASGNNEGLTGGPLTTATSPVVWITTAFYTSF